MTRRLARHPLDLCGGRKRDDGVPGAAKNTGDHARPIAIACFLTPKFTFHKPRRAEPRLEIARCALPRVNTWDTKKSGTAMSMQLITGLIYCVAVLVWLAVLGIVLFEYVRNPRIFGTTRLLLLVVAIDTCRNLIENVYFGLFLAASMGSSRRLATPRAS
jgi:hypothetical protein